MIFVVGIGAVAVCGLMAVVPTESPMVLVGMFLLGGMTFPLYSLLLTYTLDWSPPGKAIGASSSLLRVNGAGAVIGPLVASSVMGWTGPTAFFWAMVVTHGVIVIYVGYRILVADGLPMDRQGEFVALPARSSEMAIRLVGRPLKASRAALRRRKPLDPPGSGTSHTSGLRTRRPWRCSELRPGSWSARLRSRRPG